MENVDQSHETNGTKWEQMVALLNARRDRLAAACESLQAAQDEEQEARKLYLDACKLLHSAEDIRDRPKKKRASISDQIIGRLQKGPASLRSVAEAVGINNHHASVYLANLKKKGRIIRIAFGMYALPKEAARV